MIRSAIAVAVVASAGSLVSATPTTTILERATLQAGFTPGTGNGPDDFAILQIEETAGAFAGNELEIGVKAKERWFGMGNVGGSGLTYVVQSGFSPTSGAAGAPLSGDAWWNFDFSFDYGNRSVADTLVTIEITDPQSDQSVLPIVITPGIFDGTEQLVQGSQNIGFSFIEAGLGPFDPNLLGDYTIAITVDDLSGGLPPSRLGEFEITVRVVPTPGAAAALGLAGLAAVRRRR